MGRRRDSIDPYIAMLKECERKAYGYGFIAVIALGMAWFFTSGGSDWAGQSTRYVEQIRNMVAFGMLCVFGVFAFVATWFIGRLAYFYKWPERFE